MVIFIIIKWWLHITNKVLQHNNLDSWLHDIIIIIIMVLFYLFIQYYAVLKEISIR